MGASGRVEGKVVIVTGAAGGQGAAEVAWLAREGAHVVATDVVEDAPAYPTGAGAVVYRQLDVTSAEGWRTVVAEASEGNGAVHGLVNNAGITHRARLGDVSLDDWNRVLAVNVTGALLGIQAVTPVMPRGGSIVNVGSVAALTAHYTVAYTTSKWALRGLSRVASMELGPLGIRVNTIHPGYIETAMTASAPAAFLEASIAVAPLGRSGKPDDVAPLVGFLLSDESTYLSGAEIAVDGGQSAHGGAKALSDVLRAASGESGGRPAAQTNGGVTDVSGNAREAPVTTAKEDRMTRDRGAGRFPHRVTIGGVLVLAVAIAAALGTASTGSSATGAKAAAAACGTLPRVAPTDPQGALKTTTATVKSVLQRLAVPAQARASSRTGSRRATARTRSGSCSTGSRTRSRRTCSTRCRSSSTGRRRSTR